MATALDRAQLPRDALLSQWTQHAACADAELVYDESSFRLAMNADLAATTKLAEGINAFIGETAKLQAAIEAKV